MVIWKGLQYDQRTLGVQIENSMPTSAEYLIACEKL